MFQGAIGRLAHGRQQCGHRRLVADTPDCFRGGSAIVQRRRFEQTNQTQQGVMIAADTDGMNGSLANRLVGVRQGGARDRPRFGVIDPRRRPDRVAPCFGRLGRLDRLCEHRHRVLASFRHRLNGASAHRRSFVAQQAGQFFGRQFRPRQFQAARVADVRRTTAANPIDAAQHIRLMQLRRRAAELVPAAGVDDQQAAVGVFQHVGRMEINVVRDEEVFVATLERRPARLQHVSRDLVHVEETSKQVVLILGAEDARFVAR